jgi:TRAP-type transport system small permease protein
VPFVLFLDRCTAWYEKLLRTLAVIACLLLFFMMCMICSDVLLRNVRLIPGVHGLAWSNEVSESLLYVITLLAAPWLLRQGQHIRVDILLRGIAPRTAWYCEWMSDALAFVCCLVMVHYGMASTIASHRSGNMTIKTLITPEWWLISILPAAFLVLSVELLFRMRRLYVGARAPRTDAVSTG